MIKAIILDCFGVLYVPIGEDFYSAHVPDYPKHRDELRQLGRQADTGTISQDELVAKVVELMRLPADEVRAKLVSGLARNKALLEFSQSVRPKYKVGLLSNISSGTINHFFTKEEQKQYFDTVVISSDVGLAKPDPAIFTLTAERLGCLPKECIMVDDSPMHCSGALKAGMQAVIYESTHKAIQDIQKVL
ncbi:MAG TPA: HAD family phosphatase [Candidatus Saccharimonadales bacterium]|nr:HAD family phosphatase [Candidatus Saccharimonadales bacterium]